MHAGGRRFDPDWLHQRLVDIKARFDVCQSPVWGSFFNNLECDLGFKIGIMPIWTNVMCHVSKDHPKTVWGYMVK